ncbi:PLC-like phosphodiesterase [Mycena leptocephala]|nr:PLC-like phosphodiesterase [Mycena leptocephala]
MSSSESFLFDFLAQSALSEIIERAAPILGRDNECSPSSPTSNWMSKISDNTKIVDMNLPGTHDSATWNYSDARQAELVKSTEPVRPAAFSRCQERSLVQSLDDGIRVFDMRIAYNPGNDTIGFYHGVMLAPTTTLQDVLYGLYTGSQTIYDRKFEEILFSTLNNELGKKFWLPAAGELGTLGAARGKLILLQRFTYQFLSRPSNHFGIHLDSEHWTTNGGDIELVYSTEPKRLAHIQVGFQLVSDTFLPLVPPNSGAVVNITSKFETITGRLAKAMNDTLAEKGVEALYISFASAHAKGDNPPLTPNIIALGDASTKGMNELLLPWFRQRKGKHFGIVFLDFYHLQPDLVRAIIGL